MSDITGRHELPRIFVDINILLDYLYFRSEEALAAEYTDELEDALQIQSGFVPMA